MQQSEHEAVTLLYGLQLILIMQFKEFLSTCHIVYINVNSSTISVCHFSDYLPRWICYSDSYFPVKCAWLPHGATSHPVSLPSAAPVVFVLTQSCRWQHSPGGHERLDFLQRYTDARRHTALFPLPLFPSSPEVHTFDLSDICYSVKVTLGVSQRLVAPLSLSL